jgi:hypothetical protein
MGRRIFFIASPFQISAVVCLAMFLAGKAQL